MSDFDARYAIYDQAKQILVDAAPYIYFYNVEGTMAHWSHVMGYMRLASYDNQFITTWLASE